MTQYKPEIGDANIEGENSSTIGLREVISVVESASNPAKKIALEKGVLYTSYNSNSEVQRAVAGLPDSEKVFFPWSTEKDPAVNFWRTMDKLGLSFLEELSGADKINISRHGILDNAITYASHLRVWIDTAMRFQEQPPQNEVLQGERDMVMQHLADAGASEKIRDKQTALDFKKQIEEALQELLVNIQKTK